MKTLIKQEDMNALERELYDQNLLNTQPKQLEHPYERGMLISISNFKMYYDEILKNYKKQYQSIYQAFTGEKISRYDIRDIKGIPDRQKLLDLINLKIPIVVAGIHSYKTEDQYGYKSRYNDGYNHQHLFLYNVHHYLPEDPTGIDYVNSKITRNLQRYTNLKRYKNDIIRIGSVGNGKYFYTDQITPITLYDYLQAPKTNPTQDNLINYIANNRHKPEIQYPLHTIYFNGH
tara:strand:+ start:840 stop:1535 length:696 start_codon:yes stop_codon:yes gene_type:complete